MRLNASKNPKPPKTTLNKVKEINKSIIPSIIANIEFLVPLFISLFYV